MGKSKVVVEINIQFVFNCDVHFFWRFDWVLAIAAWGDFRFIFGIIYQLNSCHFYCWLTLLLQRIFKFNSPLFVFISSVWAFFSLRELRKDVSILSKHAYHVMLSSIFRYVVEGIIRFWRPKLSSVGVIGVVCVYQLGSHNWMRKKFRKFYLLSADVFMC